MFRTICTGALAMAIAGLAGASIDAATPDNRAAKTESNKYHPEQIIVIKDANKGDRRFLIQSAAKQDDGSTKYQIKALDNGETMTIFDRPQKSGTVSKDDVANRKGSKSPSASEKMVGSTAPVVQSDEASTRSTSRNLFRKTNAPPVTPRADAPSASQPKQRTGLFSRLFGGSSRQRTSSTATPSGTSMTRGGTSAKPRGIANVPATNPPGTSTEQPPLADKPAVSSTQTPVLQPLPKGVATVPSTPTPANNSGPAISGPSLIDDSPTKLPPMLMKPLGPIPQYGVTTEPDVEQIKLTTLKVKVKEAIRPSERESAAEELAFSAYGTSAEIRAILLVGAQSDPAATVRATCIRCLSKQGVKDQAFMTILVGAQQDKDERVREEANLALARMAVQK